MSERETKNRDEMGRGVTKRTNYVKWNGCLRDDEMRRDEKEETEDRNTEESQRGNYKKGACFFGIGETIYANSEQRGEWDQSSMKTFKKKEKSRHHRSKWNISECETIEVE